MPVDPFVLHAEFDNFFVSHALTHERLINEKLDTVAKVSKLSEVFKSAFPLTNKAYRLLMTSQANEDMPQNDNIMTEQ